MSLTLAGRLFHSAGAAIRNDLSPRVFFVFPMGNCNSSSSEELRWYLDFKPYMVGNGWPMQRK